jgi:hypothetical protein
MGTCEATQHPIRSQADTQAPPRRPPTPLAMHCFSVCNPDKTRVRLSMCLVTPHTTHTHHTHPRHLWSWVCLVTHAVRSATRTGTRHTGRGARGTLPPPPPPHLLIPPSTLPHKQPSLPVQQVCVQGRTSWGVLPGKPTHPVSGAGNSALPDHAVTAGLAASNARPPGADHSSVWQHSSRGA